MEEIGRTRRRSRLGDDHDDDRRLSGRTYRHRWSATTSHVERCAQFSQCINKHNSAGSAVVDFTLISLVLIPLVLGLMQVALVLHVRNTMTAAVSEGARAGARESSTPAVGAATARSLISQGISGKFATSVSAKSAPIGGSPGVVVTATAQVPALGLFGPKVNVDVSGRAIAEEIQ